MPTADWFLSPRSAPLLSTLYRRDGRTPFPYEHIVMRPSGALNASAKEMGAYLQFFLLRGQAHGKRILSGAALQRMERPTTSWASLGGLETGYGLHNYTTSDARGFLWHGHNGSVDGGMAQLNYLPEHGVGYFFAMNAAHMGAYNEIDQQMRAYATRSLPVPKLPSPMVIPSQVKKSFEGWYTPINPPREVLGFLEILGLSRVTFDRDRIHISSPFGPSHALVSVDGRRFRHDNQPAATLVLMDSADGRLVQTSSITNARVNPLRAWLQIASVYVLLLTIVSIPLFALVWCARCAFGRMRGAPNLHVRVLPLLAVMSLGAIPLILGGLGEDATYRLGHVTAWSMGLTLATCAFGGLSVASLLAALRADRTGMNRFAYYHSLGASSVLVLATLYLTYWGIVGIRTWA